MAFYRAGGVSSITQEPALVWSSPTSATLEDVCGYGQAITYNSNCNGPFVSNWNANTYYQVHNGGATPQFMCQIVKVTQTVKCVIVANLSINVNFNPTVYFRFSLQTGTNYNTNNEIGATAASGFTSNGSEGWKAVTHQTIIHLSPGTYTFWGQCDTDSVTGGCELRAALWQMVTTLTPVDSTS